MSWENNIRNRFEGAEFTPSDDVWRQVQGKIAPPPARRLAWWASGRYAMAAAVALLLTTATALWFTRQPSVNHAGPQPMAGTGSHGTEQDAAFSPSPSDSQPLLPSRGLVRSMAENMPRLSAPKSAEEILEESPETVAVPPRDCIAELQMPPLQQQPIAMLPERSGPRLAALGGDVRPLPAFQWLALPGQAAWATHELLPPPRIDLATDTRPGRWRMHLTAMPYRMKPFNYTLLANNQDPVLAIMPNDTVLTYRLPSMGMAWQASAEYLVAGQWGLELGMQVAHSIASAPLGYSYLVVLPGQPDNSSAALTSNSQEDFSPPVDTPITYTYTESHTIVRLPVLLNLYQSFGRHSFSVSAGAARLVNISRVIPMRRIDLEAIARVRYEYALSPTVSVHTGVQFGAPPPRGDILTPMHMGVQTGFSLRWPS